MYEQYGIIIALCLQYVSHFISTITDAHKASFSVSCGRVFGWIGKLESKLGKTKKFI